MRISICARCLGCGGVICLMFVWCFPDLLRKALFPIAVIFFVVPCVIGSIGCLILATLLLVSRPNSSSSPWTAGVMWSTFASCVLQILAYWIFQKFSVSAVIQSPRPVIPALCLAAIVTVGLLPLELVGARKRQCIESWPGVVGEVQGEDFEKLRRLVADQCSSYADKYAFSVRLEKAFLVENPRLMSAFDDFRADLQARGKDSNRRQFFHGTSRASAISILGHGFRLPERRGMFGKGLYFANTPLKSMQYAKAGGVILLCDVDLGNAKIQHSANSTLAPETDFKRGWFMKALGQKSYDSVQASDGTFGAVRVPEYVVYKPQQAVPRYVLVMTQTAKARSSR